METHTRGPPSRTTSPASSPSCFRARGRLASITTSALPTSPCSARIPSVLLRSSATERLRPFKRSKNPCAPRRAPSGRWVDSTFTTSAPAWARRSPQSGPAHSAERSSTSSPVGSHDAAAPRRAAIAARRRALPGLAAPGRRAARAAPPAPTADRDRGVGRPGPPRTTGRGRRRAWRRAPATPAPAPCPRHAGATPPRTRPHRAAAGNSRHSWSRRAARVP